MPFPVFILAFPGIDAPFPDDVVQTAAIGSDAGLVAFFTFLQDMTLPMHAHGAQRSTVIEGEIDLTIGTRTRACRPADSYLISSGSLHGAQVRVGTRMIDVFEEAGRYTPKDPPTRVGCPPKAKRNL